MRRAHAAPMVLKGNGMGTERLGSCSGAVLCKLRLVPKYTALRDTFHICKMMGLDSIIPKVFLLNWHLTRNSVKLKHSWPSPVVLGSPTLGFGAWALESDHLGVNSDFPLSKVLSLSRSWCLHLNSRLMMSALEGCSRRA